MTIADKQFEIGLPAGVPRGFPLHSNENQKYEIPLLLYHHFYNADSHRPEACTKKCDIYE
jgi:hypothetical protein